jgi:hypothetical protein
MSPITITIAALLTATLLTGGATDTTNTAAGTIDALGEQTGIACTAASSFGVPASVRTKLCAVSVAATREAVAVSNASANTGKTSRAK